MKSCNTEEFFREVALRIHSSLEIDEAIRAAFNYMRDFIPMDMMGMFLVEDADDGGVKVFSVSSYCMRLRNEPEHNIEPILWLNS